MWSVEFNNASAKAFRKLDGKTQRAPDAGEGGLDLLLEAGDQFAVGGDQRLLGFDGALGFEKLGAHSVGGNHRRSAFRKV